MSNEDDTPSSRQIGVVSEANNYMGTSTLWRSLPNYMTTPLTKGDDPEEMMDDIFEDNGELGNGCDSDEDCDEVVELDDSATLASQFRMLSMTDNDSNQDVVDSVKNMVILSSGTEKFNPEQLKIHCVPDDWEDPPAKTEKKEPEFKEIDNPGGWSSFSFRPVYKKEKNDDAKMYKYHSLPTGCVPVEVDENGVRQNQGWRFHYTGWNDSETNVSIEVGAEENININDLVEDPPLETESLADNMSHSHSDSNTNVGTDAGGTFRSGARVGNLFPKERLGSLDADILKHLGMCKRVLDEKNFLFFYQLVLPICDTERSGIKDDVRLPYYSQVEKWSNLYAYQLGLGGSYGHEYKNISVKEIVRHDGCIIRDGVRGGSSGAIYRRWQIGADYDDHVSMSMAFRRWLQIKRVKKLCNNDSSPKRGQENYDPTYKYNYIFKTIVHNVNYLTKCAELDATIDETSFATASPGEAGSGVTFRVMGKPGVSKGGQTVLMCDAHRIRPRAFYHRHKLHKKPDGWNAQGMIEARRLLESIIPKISGYHSPEKKIYPVKPHVTMDNYFSGDLIANWIGGNGFSCTMTCRRDRLPSGVPAKYWHKERTDGSPKTKVARFFEPVVAVLDVPASDGNESFKKVHVSFQSTSSCNIQTVNALNECKLSVSKRTRGINDNRRTWGIEMNAARELYLGTYSRIDSIDHLIKNCRLKYRSWKYWHSPMLHATSLAIVIAYDIYLECVEGKLDKDWLVNYPVDFWTFRDILSIQMLEYDPTKRKYLGDNEMRVCTKQNKKARVDDEDVTELHGGRSRNRGRPSAQILKQQKIKTAYNKAKSGRGEHSRLCGDLTRFNRHMKSLETALKHPKQCRVCGLDAYSICGLCKAPLHFLPTKGKNCGRTCFFDYHDDCFFGLAREDAKVSDFKKADWVYPSIAKKKENTRTIKSLNES